MKDIHSIDKLFKTSGIEIPLIQRDYVQGRVHEITSKTSDKLKKEYSEERNKRDKFISELLDALRYGKEKHLTFIYGVNCQNDKTGSHETCFMPLDGQQRLTTLFLLFWYFRNKCKEIPVPEELLKGLRSFRCKTRPTSDFFCECLFSENFKEAGKDTISENIKSQPWWGDNWILDPSVLSMLQMLDEIERQVNLLISNGEDASILAQNLYNGERIRFDILDMKEYRLTDELYVKMNARGKFLTTFEIFKAEIIKTLRNKFKDAEYKGESAASYFEMAIEHEWTNLLWAYCKQEIDNQKAEYPVIDRYFMNLFDSIAWIQYSIRNKDYASKSIVDIRNFMLSDIDCLKLTFEFLDALCRIQNENPGLWNELFYVAENNINLQKGKVRLKDGNPTVKLLDRCIIDNPKNFDILMLYALLQYVIKKKTVQASEEMALYLRETRNFLAAKAFHPRYDDVRIDDDLELSVCKEFDDNIKNLIEQGITPLSGDYRTIIEDFKYLRHKLPDIIISEYHYDKTLYDALTSFDTCSDDEKRKVLIANGFIGAKSKYCGHGLCRFFGCEGRWEYIFSTDQDTFYAALKKFIDNFSKGISAADQIKSALDNKIKSKTYDFTYYALNYPKYLYSPDKNLNPNFYFSINGDINNLNIMGLGNYSQSPLRAYHADPMIFCITNELASSSQNTVSDTVYMGYRCQGSEPGDLWIQKSKDNWEESNILMKVCYRPADKKLILNADSDIEIEINEQVDIVQAAVNQIRLLLPNTKFEYR